MEELRQVVNEGQKDRDSISFVIFSDTTDKMYALAIMVKSAVIMGRKVRVFVTFWALNNFKKDQKEAVILDSNHSEYETFMDGRLKEMGINSYKTFLEESYELGAKFYACKMASDLFGYKKEDYVELIDSIVTAGEFIDKSEGRIIFI